MPDENELLWTHARQQPSLVPQADVDGRQPTLPLPQTIETVGNCTVVGPLAIGQNDPRLCFLCYALAQLALYCRCFQV